MERKSGPVGIFWRESKMGKKKQPKHNAGQGDDGGPSSRRGPSSRNTGRKGGASCSSRNGGPNGGASFSDALCSAGLSLKNIVADGNCLFRAAADQLYGEQQMHKRVRESAVNYMERHENIFAAFIDTVDEPFSSYTRRMAKDGIWGGQPELQAISLAHQVNLLIYVELHDGSGTRSRNNTNRRGGPTDGGLHTQEEGAPKWDIWKMQNFGASSICLQLAFHPDVQHYSSVRVLGAPQGAPSTLTLAQLEAHRDNWSAGKLADKETEQHGGPGGPPNGEQEEDLSWGPPLSEEEPPSTAHDSSSSSSSSNGLTEGDLMAVLKAGTAATGLGPLCPACAACRLTAWRRGALFAQVNSWGPLGAPPLCWTPLGAIAAAGESDAVAIAAAEKTAGRAAAPPAVPPSKASLLRHRRRSCVGAFWNRRRGPSWALTGPRRRRSSNSSGSSLLVDEGSSFPMGAPSGGPPRRKVFVAVLSTPSGSSSETELYIQRDMPCSSSSSSSNGSSSTSEGSSNDSSNASVDVDVGVCGVEGLFSIDSLIPSFPSSSSSSSRHPASVAAAVAAAVPSATAAPSLCPRRSREARPAATETATAAATEATNAAAAAAASRHILAAQELPLPCRIRGGPALLRIELPPLPRSSSSSSSRRALSLPPLRMRLLPCAHLWLIGDAAAAAAAAARGTPCFRIAAGPAGGPPSVVRIGGEGPGAPGASGREEEAVADAAAAAAAAAAQQQQQQQRKGKLSKKEKAELKKAKKMQRYS